MIANCLDKHIYEGRYKSADSVPFDPTPLLLLHVTHRQTATAAHDGGRGSGQGRGYGRGRGGRNGNNNDNNHRDRALYSNDDEARKVVELLLNRYKSDDVLVLSPYKDQVKSIHRWIDSFFGSADVHRATELKDRVITLDQSQGQEADVVIVSLTNPRPTRFLDSKRLNVLFSRARSKFVLITDEVVLREYVRSNKHNDKRLELVHDLLNISSPFV